MGNLVTDVQNLNVAVLTSLLYSIDDESVVNSSEGIQADASVLQIIKNASAEECAAATKCGIPLISINNKSLNLLRMRSQGLSIGHWGADASESVFDVNFAALMLAYVLIKTDLTVVAKLWFDLDDESINIIQTLSMSNAHKYAKESSTLVELRNRNNPMFWRRVMMDANFANRDSHTINGVVAFMSLGEP